MRYSVQSIFIMHASKRGRKEERNTRYIYNDQHFSFAAGGATPGLLPFLPLSSKNNIIASSSPDPVIATISVNNVGSTKAVDACKESQQMSRIHTRSSE